MFGKEDLVVSELRLKKVGLRMWILWYTFSAELEIVRMADSRMPAENEDGK